VLAARAPAHNSLRALRALRSDICAESDHVARWRARALAAALLGAPQAHRDLPRTGFAEALVALDN